MRLTLLLLLLVAVGFSSCHKPRIGINSPIAGKYIYFLSLSDSAEQTYSSDDFGKIEFKIKPNGKMVLIRDNKKTEEGWFVHEENGNYHFKSDAHDWTFYMDQGNFVSDSFPADGFYNQYLREGS